MRRGHANFDCSAESAFGPEVRSHELSKDALIERSQDLVFPGRFVSGPWRKSPENLTAMMETAEGQAMTFIAMPCT